MAIRLINKPNVEGVSATYPYGNIKNNTGSNDGTPVNVEVYGDFHQFFSSLLNVYETDGFGVVNNLPENAVNGFQYSNALSTAARVANQEVMAKLAISFIGSSYQLTVPYALWGVKDEFSTISFGFILFNLKLYSVPPHFYGVIVNALQFNETAESLLTITDSATPGLFEYDDIVFLDTGWHNVGDVGEPSFSNGWSNYIPATYSSLGFRRVGFNEVLIRGNIKDGANGVIFLLPPGYRPEKEISMSGVKPGVLNEPVLITVTPVGEVSIFYSGSNTRISLDSIIIKLG